jgi:hypothetical protein
MYQRVGCFLRGQQAKQSKSTASSKNTQPFAVTP